MITIRRADERGQTENDWLDSRHSFSFGEYFDPEKMGFRTLRVLNDDTVQPGRGFPMHGHREMEILTYVLRGQIRHDDDMESSATLGHGGIQRMYAGTGIHHSEKNASDTEILRFIQIWIVPSVKGGEPAYEQQDFDLDAAKKEWVVLAAPQNGLVTVNQDVVLAATIVRGGDRRALEFNYDRAGYLFVARGTIRFHGNELHAGDAAEIEDERRLEVEAVSEAELLAFDIG